MNPLVVAGLCAELTLLRFFPADENGRAALIALVGCMCSNEDQVRWLVQRTLALCNEWPGPVGLRQILCSKFKPADGIEAGSTSLFPDGPPSEKQIETPALIALPSGHVATVDAGYDKSIRALAITKDLNRVHGPAPVQEVPTNLHFKPITQADIDKAIDELREKRARAELLPEVVEGIQEIPANPISEADVKAAEAAHYQKKLEGKPN